jgi:hypothetical protein
MGILMLHGHINVAWAYCDSYLLHRVQSFSGVSLLTLQNQTTPLHRLDYTGPALTSLAAYSWRVRVLDTNQTWSSWSQPASFATGLMKPKEEFTDVVTFVRIEWEA